MLRVTSLCVVMVLAGTPASSLACELWCATTAAQDHRQAAGCHEAADLPDTEQLVAIGDCQAPALVEPFLAQAREKRVLPPGAVPAVLTAHRLEFDRSRATTGWRVFGAAPPLSASLHVVLRI